MGYIRLLGIPIIFFYFINSFGALKDKIKNEKWLSLPILLLLLYFFVLPIFIPSSCVQNHFSASVKCVFWFLCYLVIIANADARPDRKVKYLLNVLVLIFFSIIVFYPYLILNSGFTLGNVVKNGLKLKLSFLLGAANEDANGLVTVLPFVLFALRKHRILRLILIAFTGVSLLFNGTRTAQIMFLLILFLFFSATSKRKFIWMIFLVFMGLSIGQFIMVYLNRILAFETLDAFLGLSSAGNLGFRVALIWIPTLNFMFHYSPVFGLGTGGWNYLALKILPMDSTSLSTVPPHNTYLWIYVCWGIIGLTQYLLFLGAMLAKSIKIAMKKKGKWKASLGTALVCSIFGYGVWSFMSNSYWAQGWIILLITSSLILMVTYFDMDNVKQPYSSG